MNAADPAAGHGLHDQPHAIVERDGVRYTLLGTAHVSQASVDAVNAELASGRYDTIAVELDAQRHKALTDPDALSRLDLFQILREGKTMADFPYLVEPAGKMLDEITWWAKTLRAGREAEAAEAAAA